MSSEVTIGVGDGSGHLFVHGSYDAVKRVQQFIFATERSVRVRTLVRKKIEYWEKVQNSINHNGGSFAAQSECSSHLSDLKEILTALEEGDE